MIAQKSTLLRLSLCLITISAPLAGCEKTVQNMYDQPRYKPLAESPLWGDGRASRPLPEGAVAYSEGTLAGTSSGRAGISPPGSVTAAISAVKRQAWTLATLERGRERFDIFCAPCHSETGDGDGMIVRRGFPRPASFHSDRLRQASDDYLYSVISEGYGAMYPYSEHIAADDRRAIVGYVRALQLSQNAKLADVPSEARRRLERTP
ncbi:MAG: cytochrome c [Betaproteobacteria bacterium]|nr:MAG: cytochrome c [Betaproteobacteria bacterium]